MRLLIPDHIETAVHSLRINRLRTTLTIIGLMIGVASITTIMCLAGGVSNVIGRQVSSVGGNIAVIRPGVSTTLTARLSRLMSSTQYNTSTLTESDLTALAKANPSFSIAPIMTFNASLKSQNATLDNMQVLATTPALEKTTKLPLDQGQFIDTTTSDNTAIIGAQLAVDLFGTNSPLGQTFQLHGEDFTIIGVLKPFNDPFNYDGVDYDNAVIIDLTAGKLLHEGRAQIQQLTVRAPSKSALDTAIPVMNKLLLERHGERDFSIVSGKAIAESTNGLFNVLSAVMSAIAAISLVVGGIGVMNIMLVGVAERTREIGIRKAVGASNKMIVFQFLIESLIMSICGGILGYTLGVVLAFVVGMELFFNPIVTWQSGVAALIISVGVGVLFGIYPALRAARKDPIESLRQYR